MIEAGRWRLRAFEGVRYAAVTCGVCRRSTSFATTDSGDGFPRSGAAREGWRICGEFGWCCPTCALGSPGLYVQQENRRRLRARRRARREELAARRKEIEPPPEIPPVRGFGMELIGDVLDRLVPPEEEDDPE